MAHFGPEADYNAGHNNFPKPCIGGSSSILGVSRGLAFFREPDLEFITEDPRPLEFEILSQNKESFKVNLFKIAVGNRRGLLSETALGCTFGVQLVGTIDSFVLPWQAEEGPQVRVKENVNPNDPTQVLKALTTSTFRYSKKELDRGVYLYILLGFSLPSTKKFYFARWPPKEYNLEEEGAQAFVDEGGTIPISAKHPVRLTLHGRNFSGIESKVFAVLSPSEGEFEVHHARLGKDKPIKKKGSNKPV